MSVPFSSFARSLSVESAFSVLAIAKSLKATGKDVVELEIGDSPFETPAAAKSSGIAAIQANQTHYCPSPGLPEFRAAAAAFVREEFGIPATAENISVGPGAKVFEQYFCEAFLEPNDGVLVFSPQFPTYAPNIQRRGGRMVTSALQLSNQFRPSIADIERFISTDMQPKALFLNSPHNPTGGVTTEQDLRDIADLVRGKNIAVFSDEPYCHMVWEGRHHSILAQPGMLEQSVAAYTFSKSYSMSGWRLGFAVASIASTEVIGKLINTTVSCTPPIVQMAGLHALTRDRAERDRQMALFKDKVQLLNSGLSKIDGVTTLPPAATFYVFPNVQPICQRLGITSHGLALYLLEGADDEFGVACLGGECFGSAGAGFLRLSCAESNERLQQALDFIPVAVSRVDRVAAFLEARPHFRLSQCPVE